MAGYKTFEQFADILAYNFGLIYDALVTSLISVEMSDFFMAGYAFGNMLYLLFFLV